MLPTSPSRKSPLVAAVIASDSVAGRAELRGIASAARRLGWTLESVDPALAGTDFSRIRPFLERADGLIVRLWDSMADGSLASLGNRTPLAGIDMGLVGRDPRQVKALWSVVLSDHRQIGEAAADELLATGRRVFAFMPMFRRFPWSGRRGEAFLSRIRAAGCEAHLYRPTTEYGWTAERAPLAEWLAALPRPFGVFAANDQLAALVYGACHAAGLSVPQDVAVVGADDDETLCQSLEPRLTSVRIDFEGAGRLAAEKLAALMAGGSRPSRPSPARYGILGVARRGSTRTDVAPGVDARLASGLDFIALHFSDPFVGASDVARAMGVGRRQADRLFAAAGKSIRRQFEETRLAAARSLLSGTDRSVAEIAAACGFSSANYFSFAFRSRSEDGLSPESWRRKTRPSPS